MFWFLYSCARIRLGAAAWAAGAAASVGAASAGAAAAALAAAAPAAAGRRVLSGAFARLHLPGSIKNKSKFKGEKCCLAHISLGHTALIGRANTACVLGTHSAPLMALRFMGAKARPGRPAALPPSPLFRSSRPDAEPAFSQRHPARRPESRRFAVPTGVRRGRPGPADGRGCLARRCGRHP